MSYARSPRPVCSMTMGTNIICGSFTFTCHTPAKHFWSGGDLKASASRGLMIQKVEGFLVAESGSDSIEGAITCQTGANRLWCLFGLCSDGLNFPIDFLVADFDMLQIGNLL